MLKFPPEVLGNLGSCKNTTLQQSQSFFSLECKLLLLSPNFFLRFLLISDGFQTPFLSLKWPIYRLERLKGGLGMNPNDSLHLFHQETVFGR